MEYQTVLLAGLLHDIGKFLQRGDFPGSLRIEGKHPEVSARFVASRKEFFSTISDFNLLIELVQRHHERTDFPETLQVQKAPRAIRHLAYLVSKADNYSSAERGVQATGRRDYRKTPLLNCFAQLQLEKPVPIPLAYQPGVLSPGKAFPEPVNVINPKVLSKHLTDFGEAFDAMVSNLGHQPFEVTFSHLVALIHRYTWCVPSNTQEEYPDVSLYDHLRTTSAIVACLYQYHRANGQMDIDAINDSDALKIRLISGDLSGIQSYIFDVSNIGASGIGKRLRARSFYLSALSDVVSHYIVHHFGLPMANVVVSSGGHFYILAPNVEGSDGWVEQLQVNLDAWSWKRFGGEVRVSLAQVPFSGQEFRHFSSVLEKVGVRMAERKSKPLHGYLASGGVWANRFCRETLADPSKGVQICAVCSKNQAKADAEDILECDACRLDRTLGTDLARARYLVYSRGTTTGGFHLFGDYHVQVTDKAPTPKMDPYLVLKLNDSDLTEIGAYPAGFRYLANYIPLAEGNVCRDCKQPCGEPPPAPGNPLYFDCLASKAHGRRVLGCLKADVDHLGALLLLGLRGESEDRMSISRLATVSRMLDLYFAGWVNSLLQEVFVHCYTVFSGGDDLLIIGPWDEVTRLALCIREDFERFVNNNPNVTLSAGIAFTGARAPLSRCVHAAEEALEAAKESPSRGATEGRDQVSLLGDVVKWSLLPGFLEQARRLKGWHGMGIISTSVLYRLKRYGQMYQEYLKDGAAENLRFIPLLTYDAARNLPGAGDRDPEKAALRLWVENLKNDLGSDRETAYLPLIVDYTLMLKE